MRILEVYSEFEKLSPYNRKQFYNMIYPVVNNSSDEIKDYLKDIRETRFAKGAYCPHCKSTHIIGHGKYLSRQRYKCKDCGKTFKIYHVALWLAHTTQTNGLSIFNVSQTG